MHRFNVNQTVQWTVKLRNKQTLSIVFNQQMQVVINKKATINNKYKITSVKAKVVAVRGNQSEERKHLTPSRPHVQFELLFCEVKPVGINLSYL